MYMPEIPSNGTGKYEYDPGLYRNLLQFKQRIYRLAGSGNVKIFDFQNDFAVTHSLDDYKDLSHFSQAINRRLVEYLKSDQFRVSAENAAVKLREFESDVARLELPAVPQSCERR